MKLPFREHHLLNILNSFDQQLPLDVFLSHYFRAHKAVGAKDRRFISETIYGMIRWLGLIDFLTPAPLSWDKRYQTFQTLNPSRYAASKEIPLHIRASFPKAFFQILCDALGEAKALQFCYTSNTKAPTTIRVNALKTTREALIQKWAGAYQIEPCQLSPSGIRFHEKINFFSLPEFKEGLFEIQDEASQLVADLIKAKPGDHVLDFCAGSGGKTLAFSPLMQNKGIIYLHDIRSRALEEAKKRLRRSGTQNAQLLQEIDPRKNRLKKKMQWVLVDAPCSGSGTLRRNPDMKWKFDPEMVDRLVQEQRSIFAQALEFLHPEGRIVYATCSVLPQENEEQIAYFMKQFNLEMDTAPFSSFPEEGKMDGFFAASLRLKRNIL
jgi:16S rRNA (cytosine967-C5)-methyltransferase